MIITVVVCCFLLAITVLSIVACTGGQPGKFSEKNPTQSQQKTDYNNLKNNYFQGVDYSLTVTDGVTEEKSTGAVIVSLAQSGLMSTSSGKTEYDITQWRYSSKNLDCSGLPNGNGKTLCTLTKTTCPNNGKTTLGLFAVATVLFALLLILEIVLFCFQSNATWASWAAKILINLISVVFLCAAVGLYAATCTVPGLVAYIQVVKDTAAAKLATDPTIAAYKLTWQNKWGPGFLCPIIAIAVSPIVLTLITCCQRSQNAVPKANTPAASAGMAPPAPKPAAGLQM
jgi:hypothetical protein